MVRTGQGSASCGSIWRKNGLVIQRERDPLSRYTVRSRAAAVVLAALATLGFSACLPRPEPWSLPSSGSGPEPTPFYVGVIGDSLTMHAETEGPYPKDTPNRFLTNDLNDLGHAASVSATVGTRATELVDFNFPTPDSDLIVIALGTNDMDGRFNEGAAIDPAPSLNEVSDLVARSGSDCAVLVTITESAPWRLDANGPAYNDGLRALDQASDQIALADWTPIAAARPELFTADLVHHTTEGMRVYRQFIVDAVQAHLPVNGVCS